MVERTYAHGENDQKDPRKIAGYSRHYFECLTYVSRKKKKRKATENCYSKQHETNIQTEFR